MVQKGKLSACAFPEDTQLNKVDFPTLGSPTIPHLSAMNQFLLFQSHKTKNFFTNCPFFSNQVCLFGTMIRIILCLVVFWNVENYFDPFDDPLTNDNDFTPQGYYSWTWKRFLKKRNDLAKVLIACGQHDSGNGSGSANNSGNGSANSTWEAPCIIGLCEVENFFVLHQLVTDSPLAPLGYGIVHRDYKDTRGIEVAQLNRKTDFNLLEKRF